ncbi:hypothetical protein A9Q81_22170 [Gammaproteobacteria bacterium 42_54_T18]|nr:hypothetical protein A9Q81_22170 [Gammaproteobacteria bacterium 42_54_T18]
MKLEEEQTEKYKGPYPSRKEVTRERLLDACVLSVAEYGLRKVKMNHIIEHSGLSRPSVYKYYKNKEAVLVDAFTREVIRLSQGLAHEMTKHRKLEDKFVYGLMYAYEVVPENPMVRLIIGDNTEIRKFINTDTQDANVITELGFSEVVAEYPKLKKDIYEIYRYWQRSLLPLFLVPGEELETQRTLEKYLRQRVVPGFGLEKYLK